jgi:hypothetical protein
MESIAAGAGVQLTPTESAAAHEEAIPDPASPAAHRSAAAQRSAGCPPPRSTQDDVSKVVLIARGTGYEFVGERQVEQTAEEVVCFGLQLSHNETNVTEYLQCQFGP